MPDLSDEPLPLNVYNVPGIGTAQLGDAQRVDGTACVYLRADIGYPPAVTSGKCPHGYSYRRPRLDIASGARAIAAAGVSECVVAFMAGTFVLHMIRRRVGDRPMGRAT